MQTRARAPNLGRVAASPELAAQRPPDLQPVRMRRKRVIGPVRQPHPRFRRQERIDLTPVIVDRRTRQTPAADDLTAHPVVGDPFVDPVATPRIAHELRLPSGLLGARLPALIPASHLVVVVHEP